MPLLCWPAKTREPKNCHAGFLSLPDFSRQVPMIGQSLNVVGRGY
jgi:hypothetical protein